MSRLTIHISTTSNVKQTSLADFAADDSPMETIKDGDITPGHLFIFNDTHKGRRQAFSDLIRETAKLQADCRELRVWFGELWQNNKSLEKRVKAIESQHFKEFDRKISELDKREKELKKKVAPMHSVALGLPPGTVFVAQNSLNDLEGRLLKLERQNHKTLRKDWLL